MCGRVRKAAVCLTAMNSRTDQHERHQEEQRLQRVKAHLDQILSQIRLVGSRLAESVDQPEQETEPRNGQRPPVDVA
jgi:hypothetical protein